MPTFAELHAQHPTPWTDTISPVILDANDKVIERHTVVAMMNEAAKEIAKSRGAVEAVIEITGHSPECVAACIRTTAREDAMTFLNTHLFDCDPCGHQVIGDLDEDCVGPSCINCGDEMKLLRDLNFSRDEIIEALDIVYRVKLMTDHFELPERRDET